MIHREAVVLDSIICIAHSNIQGYMSNNMVIIVLGFMNILIILIIRTILPA